MEDGRDADPYCGGTLVNSRHIVTAAHCTHNKTANSIAVTVIGAERICSTLAQIGDHNISETATEPEERWISVEEIIEHPGYDGDVVNDIAVIRLAEEVN